MGITKDEPKVNLGGRPLKFETVQELQDKIKAYFESCWRPKLDMFGNRIKDKETGQEVLEQFKPYTISGMAVFLDTSRETLMDYQDEEKRPGYSDTIKAAKEVCYAYTEESLFMGKNPSGSIFSLKNNYGWKDQTQTDLTSGGERIKIDVGSVLDKTYGSATIPGSTGEVSNGS